MSQWHDGTNGIVYLAASKTIRFNDHRDVTASCLSQVIDTQMFVLFKITSKNLVSFVYIDCMSASFKIKTLTATITPDTSSISEQWTMKLPIFLSLKMYFKREGKLGFAL